MLKIEVRAINDALCADIVDYIWVKEDLSDFERAQKIFREVDDWMRDYCEDKDDEEYVGQYRIEILGISKE